MVKRIGGHQKQVGSPDKVKKVARKFGSFYHESGNYRLRTHGLYKAHFSMEQHIGSTKDCACFCKDGLFYLFFFSFFTLH